MNELLQTIGGVFMGPGAFGDPSETFKLYAPPNLLDVYSPEQQAQYGKQIQAQMRRINADYRPSYSQMQSGIVDSARIGIERANAARALKQQEQMRGDLGQIFGFGAPSAAGAPIAPPLTSSMANPAMGQTDTGAGAGEISGQGMDPNAPKSLDTVTVSAPRLPPPGDRKTQAMKYFKAAKYFASRGDADTAKKYHEMGMNFDPNPSQEIRDLEYLGFGIEGTEKEGLGLLSQLNQSKVAGGAENKALMAWYDANAKRMPELESQARKAAQTNDQLSRLGDMNDEKTFTGMLAPGAIGAAQFASSLGLNIKPETLANSREFQAAANILVLDFMGAMGGARGFSKEESAILYDAFPKIIDSPQARARIIRMLKRRNNDIINEFNFVRKDFETSIGRRLPTPDLKPLELGGGAPAAGGAAPTMRYDPKTKRLVPVGQ
jgi:hypothetical protein